MVVGFYMGLKAAAWTLTRTSPGLRSDGTGSFLSNTTAFVGCPRPTTFHALWTLGIVKVDCMVLV